MIYCFQILSLFLAAVLLSACGRQSANGLNGNDEGTETEICTLVMIYAVSAEIEVPAGAVLDPEAFQVTLYSNTAAPQVLDVMDYSGNGSKFTVAGGGSGTITGERSRIFTLVVRHPDYQDQITRNIAVENDGCHPIDPKHFKIEMN